MKLFCLWGLVPVIKWTVSAGFAAQAECTGHVLHQRLWQSRTCFIHSFSSFLLKPEFLSFGNLVLAQWVSLPPCVSLFSPVRSAVWIPRLSLLLTCCCFSFQGFSLLQYPRLHTLSPFVLLRTAPIRSTILTLFCVVGQEISHSKVKDEKRT